MSVPGTYFIRAIGSGSPVIKLSEKQFITGRLEEKSFWLIMLAFKNVDQQDIIAWVKSDWVYM